MNERFKFRVWDKQQKKYEDLPKLINQKGELVSFTVRDDLSKFYGIEQCTGAKDKNGKLVYEGDFIKTPNGSIGYIVWSQQDLAFYTKDLNPKEREVYLAECEVVGNIHENADLLENEE